MKKLMQLLAVAVICAGCHGMQPRAKGGHLSSVTSNGKIETVQPENPKDAATQDVEVNDLFELPVPGGAVVSVPTVTKAPGGGSVTNETKITMPTNALPVV